MENHQTKEYKREDKEKKEDPSATTTTTTTLSSKGSRSDSKSSSSSSSSSSSKHKTPTLEEHEEEITTLQKDVKEVKKELKEELKKDAHEAVNTFYPEGTINPAAPPVNPGSVAKSLHKGKKTTAPERKASYEEGEENPDAPRAGI